MALPTNSSSITRLGSYAEQSPVWGVFVQDDGKVTSMLTLNMEMRWEYGQPLTGRYNRSVADFDPSFVQSFEAAARAAYASIALKELPADQFKVRGGLRFAEVGGQGRNLYGTPKRHLAPRIEFAYLLPHRSVVRGGNGIIFGFVGQRRNDVQQAGFNGITNMTVSNDNGLPFATKLANPLPNGVNPALGAAEGGAIFLNQTLDFFDPRPLTPYNQRWQFSVQHEFKGGSVAGLAYVGSRGTRLEIARNYNTLPRQFLGTSPLRDDAWRT